MKIVTFLLHVTAGFCLGGPFGAFIGGMAGGKVAGAGATAVVNAFTPKQEANKKACRVEKRPMAINKQYLHRFRRRPAVRDSIDNIYFRIKGN